MKKSRLKNSMYNLIYGFGYRFLILFTAFVVRTVFVKCLSRDYLGVNGLYSSILSMLSLAELGFGSAMVYSMYQPLAENDMTKLKQIMNLYKKVYLIIGTVIFIIGICLIPFLPSLVKNTPNINGLTFYYVLFLFSTVSSYWFWGYQSSILSADQKAYIISKYNSLFNLIKSAAQIILLLVFQNYTVYLITQIICNIGQNIALAYKTKRMYHIFDDKEISPLPNKEKKRIFKDVEALVLSKVSHVILNSTDNIIISAFVGIEYVALLSNYSMIVEAITGILTQITGAITGSLGNYFAVEDKESSYQLFCRIEFLNFWLYSFCMISLIVLLNPFITIWLGEDYLLNNLSVFALGINFFVAGFMNTLWTFRSTLGLFTQGKFRPVIVAVINVVLSIWFSTFLGVAGVLLATSISRTCVNLWYDPIMLHHFGFQKKAKPFFIKYFWKLLYQVIILFFMVWLKSFIFANGVTLFSFIFMTILTGIVPNLCFLLLFFKTDEFVYFKNLLLNVIKK